MENTRTTLTLAQIERAQPQPKPYRLWDSRVPGLFLRIQPSGVKTWNVQWARGTSKSLGRYPIVPLNAARIQALAVLGDAAANGTPSAAKPRLKDGTLREFLSVEYRPWAKTQLKRAQEASERIERVFAELLDRPLRDVSAFLIEKVRTKRMVSGVSSSTCNRDLTSLHGALSKAVEWGLLKENPFATVKSAKLDATGVVRFLDASEESHLRAALERRDAGIRSARQRANNWRSERQKELMPAIADNAYGDYLTPMVIVAMNTGLRRGELTSITWTDVDIPAKRLTVRAGYAKSGKARHIPLNSEALSALQRWKQQNGDETIVFNVHDPKKAWTALLRAAEIESFRFHDLRHHFASRLVMAGVDLNTVRELLGHADLKMTLRYAHLAPEHKAEAVERISRAA